jgi:uncharacterized membrane protein YkvA (DUF1232 family)
MNDTELLILLDNWVKELAEDAKALRDAMGDPGTSREAKKYIIGGLSYLLRKVDIIPDYMGGIGVLDDASVLRVAADLSMISGVSNASDHFKKLAKENDLVKILLEDHYIPFENYVKRLPVEKIRNRTAETILDEPGSLDQFDREFEDEVRGYTPKPLGQNERTIREFRSFMKSKIK